MKLIKVESIFKKEKEAVTYHVVIKSLGKYLHKFYVYKGYTSGKHAIFYDENATGVSDTFYIIGSFGKLYSQVQVCLKLCEKGKVDFTSLRSDIVD